MEPRAGYIRLLRACDGKLTDKRGEVGKHCLALFDPKKLIVLVPVHEGLGAERNVGEIDPGEFGLIARDRFGNAVCLVVKDRREDSSEPFRRGRRSRRRR